MLQDKFPLVSIVIPVYNGSNYLREAIDSALSQTYENIEIIVVNDGSNDNGATDSIALSYGDKIRYIKKENGGVSSALNAGIKAMNGIFFSWLSHDDKYLPDKVKSQIEALAQCKEKDVIAICGAKQINDKSEEIYSQKKRSLWDENHINDLIRWDDALVNLINYGSFGGCTLLIPKHAFERAGLFDESLRYCQDFLMWIRIFLSEYSLMRTPGTYVCSRVHGAQLTQTGRQLFHHDSIAMGDMLLPAFIQKSTKSHNFLKSFAIYNSKYNTPEVVEKYIIEGRKEKLIDSLDVLQIKMTLAFGKIRPIIRKVYYRTFRNIGTN